MTRFTQPTPRSSAMPQQPVRASDREDFEAMPRLRNLSADDFDLTATPTHVAAPPGAIGPASNRIIVRSRRSGVERAYVNGGGSTSTWFVAWVNDAAEDVDAGIFA